MTELKPCPFCGNKEAYYTKMYVKCPKCKARTADFHDIKLAFAAWNTRAPAVDIHKLAEDEVKDLQAKLDLYEKAADRMRQELLDWSETLEIMPDSVTESIQAYDDLKKED